MRYVYLALALIVASLNLRPAITSVSPLLVTIRDHLGMSGSAASLLTSIPVLCMGVFAPTAVKWSRRWGIERTIAYALALIGLATVARLFADSTLALLFTSFAAGIGIAVSGPLLSGFIKKHFSGKAPLFVGMYSMSLVIGAAASAGLSVSVQTAMNGSWQAALASWSALALLALVLWGPLAWKEKANRSKRTGGFSAAGRLPLADKRAWLLTAYFGLMAFLFYSITAWLAPAIESAGYDKRFAGAVLTLFTFIQIPVSLLIPLLIARFPKRMYWLVGSTLFELAGLIDILLSGNPWAAGVLLGVGAGGLFPIALMLPIEETSHAEAANAWSAMVQSGGYMFGSLGPLFVGWLQDVSGGFAPAFAGLAVAALVMIAVQVAIGNKKTSPAAEGAPR
ncbi:CynX/NimT family MFS transporter [Paenibacillus flagellatus]|uniref:MFS transporter n=1 Tax=Paenibacillus flagellatus TaxID=2211139 RepID=A0A2V5JZZ1_9BACL|nr:MFS transporter [Paenibacillus flagellatus]PYI51872.1 MFS transporter [Paenibacillus flagellatus]